jgi:hypothetical protein
MKGKYPKVKTKGIPVDTHHMIPGTAGSKDEANAHMHGWIKTMLGLKGRLPDAHIWVDRIPGSSDHAVFAEERKKKK